MRNYWKGLLRMRNLWASLLHSIFGNFHPVDPSRNFNTSDSRTPINWIINEKFHSKFRDFTLEIFRDPRVFLYRSFQTFLDKNRKSFSQSIQKSAGNCVMINARSSRETIPVFTQQNHVEIIHFNFCCSLVDFVPLEFLELLEFHGREIFLMNLWYSQCSLVEWDWTYSWWSIQDFLGARVNDVYFPLVSVEGNCTEGDHSVHDQ